MNNHNFPSQPGLYWARTSTAEGWYRVIVRVGGEPPFMRIVWSIDEIADDLRRFNPYDLYFGPEIHRPDVPKEEISK